MQDGSFCIRIIRACNAQDARPDCSGRAPCSFRIQKLALESSELVTETETGFSSLGRDGHVIVLAGRVDGTFVITGEAIDLRALAERIFVGSGETL